MGQKLDVQLTVCTEATYAVDDNRFCERSLPTTPVTASANPAASTLEAHRQLSRDYGHFIKPDQKRACKSMRIKLSNVHFLPYGKCFSC